MHRLHQLSGQIQHHSGADGESNETRPAETRRPATCFRRMAQDIEGGDCGHGAHGVRLGVVDVVPDRAGDDCVAALTVKLHLPVIACPSRLRTCQVTVTLPPVIGVVGRNSMIDPVADSEPATRRCRESRVTMRGAEIVSLKVMRMTVTGVVTRSPLRGEVSFSTE